jgi:hypothetical protein
VFLCICAIKYTKHYHQQVLGDQPVHTPIKVNMLLFLPLSLTTSTALILETHVNLCIILGGHGTIRLRNSTLQCTIVPNINSYDIRIKNQYPSQLSYFDYEVHVMCRVTPMNIKLRRCLYVSILLYISTRIRHCFVRFYDALE